MTNLELIVGLLRHEEIPFEMEWDVPLLMKASRGRLNPSTAAGVWAFPNNPALRTLLIDIYQTVDFIRDNGLVRV